MPITARVSKKKLIIALLLLGLCLVTYGNSFQNDFLMDDYPMLIKNQQLGGPDFLQLNIHPSEHQKYFRPIAHLLILVTHHFFGDDPLGYHLFNLSLFYLACCALYELIAMVIKDKNIALLTSLFFCTHPINGVLVNFKNATGFALLVLAATLSLIHFIKASRNQHALSNRGIGLIWLLIALLCHESIVAFVFYLAFILWFLENKRFKDVLSELILPLTVTIFYLSFRTVYVNFEIIRFNQALPINTPLVNFIATYAKLIGWYISKLLSPEGIVLIWATSVVQNYWTIFRLNLCLGTILFLIIWLWIKYPKPNKTLFAISWILTGFLPVALGCLLRPNFGIIIEPHWLIFSSIGYFLLLAIIFSKAKNIFSKRIWYSILSILLFCYISYARHYNYLWGNQIRYCSYWINIAPDRYWPNFWLGYAYLENKDYAKARKFFEKILETGNGDFETLGNLGLSEYYLGNLEASLYYFNKSLNLNSNYADTYYYIGKIHLKKNHLIKAKQAFSRATELDPALIDSRTKLNSILKTQNLNSQDKL